MKGSFFFFAFLLFAKMLGAEPEEDKQSGKLLPTIGEYFPELKGDLTKVTWAHAVNSLMLLEKALTDKNVMMLEADVVLGTLVGENETIPIMAHPPNTKSDLSLEMFLKKVLNVERERRKGIKLDFKSIESFEASSRIIDLFFHQFYFPVLLNADILPGPVNSSVKPVDPKRFLKLSKTKYQGTTLSLGWTTKFGPGMKGGYAEEQLQSMRAAIEENKIAQPVTLCVRAGIAANSSGIKSLVEKIDEYQKSKSTSVTIWMSSDSDPVDVPKLKDLILALKKSRVLLDVPKFIHDRLDLDSNAARTPINAAQGALVALLTSVSGIFTNMF